jgi:hypothetical protein
MSDAARIACRMATAIGLTLFCFFLLQIPNSFRALNTVVMLCGIVVFQRGMMKQRLILIWISGFMGMGIDVLFREAPWFYLPAYMVLIYTTMHIASLSRDAATMMLLVFGYSGSVPTSDLFYADPIIAGFQRALGVSLGVIMAITAFLIFPVRKKKFFHHPDPVSFGRRDLLFLAVSGAALLCTGATVIKHYGTFVVMLGLAWALGLPTQSTAVMRLQLIGLALGNCMALAMLTVFSASSNNPAAYITVIATIIGTAAYLGARYPGLKPAQSLFAIGVLVPISFAFRPLPNVTVLFPLFISMWLGVLVSTIIFLIFRSLEEVEKTVMGWGVSRKTETA